MSAARAAGGARFLLLATTALLGACMTRTPVPMRSGEVGPAAIGRLLTVEGRLTQLPLDDQPWGWKLFIDDGSGALLVFIAPESQIDASRLAAGQRLRVTGTVARYEQHIELLPRTPADLQPLP